MFLSLVETADDSSALSLRRTEVFIKRYNVAASRARNQLWVLGGLDPDSHLKTGDLREVLIRHVLDPQRTMLEVSEMNPRDSKEIDTGNLGARRMSGALQKELEGAGYRVSRDFVVGSYKLDLVVEGRNQRVALRCDGDREHAPDRFKVIVEREAVLERLGWRFVSLRASQYYRQPEETVRKLLDRLRELGLEPAVGGLGDPTRDDGQSLYRRVTDRAAQLRRIWSGEEVDQPAISLPQGSLLDVSQLPSLPSLASLDSSGGLGSMPGLPEVSSQSAIDKFSSLPPLQTEGPSSLPPFPGSALPPLPEVPPSLPPLPANFDLPPAPPLGAGGIPEIPSIPSIPPLPPSLNLPMDMSALPGIPDLPKIPDLPGSGGDWQNLLNSSKSETPPNFLPLQLPDEETPRG
jgi:very-short-patch-repair endonuclease